MNQDLQRFQRRMEQQLAEFQNPALKNRRCPSAAVSGHKGIRVEISVRKGKSCLNPDIRFIHVSDSLCREIALMEAEKAAREAGYPHRAFIIAIDNLE